MTAINHDGTDHDDQFREIYPAMLNYLNCTFGVIFHDFIAVAVMVIVCGCQDTQPHCAQCARHFLQFQNCFHP